MNAMIFAAGLGTRLFPLTSECPKALVPLNGKPLISYAIQKVVEAGATRVVVNVHHFASQVIDYLKQNPVNGVEFIVSDETEQLLETGGGLLKAKDLFLPHQPILIYNSDVVTTVDLRELVMFHSKNRAMASLMVRYRPTTRFFLFGRENRLRGWENTQTGERKGADSKEELKQLAFCGIHIVEYNLLNLLGETRKFSIVDGYLSLMEQYSIVGWEKWTGHWYDVGTPQKLLDAELQLKGLEL
jgi:NDP-sugar pyrophosphorylase family protein